MRSPSDRWIAWLTARFPLRRVSYETGPHHVQIDVDHAASQMLAAFDGGCVIAVLPACASAMLALVELLTGAPSDQLHAARDLATTAVAPDEDG